jgi:hypothetical protein
MNCFNHQDKPAVAECRFCGKNVCGECAVELGRGRGVACSIVCERMARALFRKAEWRRRFGVAAFVVVSLALTIVLALATERRGGPWLLFLLPYAGGSVMMTWFFFFTSWHFYMWVTRGAPFRAGDAVVVTEGPHRGIQGDVVRLSAGSATTVVVNLTVEGVPVVHHFGWEELRKIRKPPPPRRG